MSKKEVRVLNLCTMRCGPRSRTLIASFYSRKGSHEELKAGSWTHVRNKDPGMLVQQEAINRMCVQRPEGESRLGLQSKGRQRLEFSWDGLASNQSGHQCDLCMPSQSKDPSITLPRVK